jgi:hypothetical protein
MSDARRASVRFLRTYSLNQQRDRMPRYLFAADVAP